MEQGVADERGFTLVELVVVVVILAVLAGIAITTYISQAEKARAAAAVSSHKTAVLVAETLRVDAEDPGYEVSATKYAAAQSSLTWVAGGSPSIEALMISVDGDSDTHVSFAVRGGDRCFYQRLEIGVGEPSTHVEPIGSGVTCRASEYPLGDARNSGF